MSLYKTFDVNYFFVFNKATIEKHKFFSACTNDKEYCENHHHPKTSFYECKEERKFCPLCGHPWHTYEKVSTVITDDAGTILHHLYSQENDPKIVSKLENLIWTPESRNPSFACLNFNVREQKPNFSEDDFLVMDGNFKIPEMTVAQKKDVGFVLDYINGKLGNGTVELHFGAFSYSH